MPDLNLPIVIAAHPTAEMVRVIEHRSSRDEHDFVSVKVGGPESHLDLLGDLNTMQLIVAEMARGLVAIEAARRGPEGVA